MQLQIALLSAIVAACHCTHSFCSWDLRDPCASAATQAHAGDIAIPVIPGHPNSPNASESREKRAATSIADRLWPGAVVYYTMSNSFSNYDRRIIYMAMHHWESHTCIRFRPRTTQHSYINFFPGSGCCSYVGMYNCGQQGISLGRCNSMSNAVHEIGHVVGFWHEQSRPDRDQYVKVLFNNIIDGRVYNFEKLPRSEIDSLGVGYDYNSIMHYRHNSWSKSSNLDTIQSKVPGIQVGAGTGLSPLDIEQANRLYRCDRQNPPPLATVVPPLPTPRPPTKPLPCGSVILGLDGSFNSPGYYNFDYRRNQECAWVLKGPENHRLTLTFTTLMKDRLTTGCHNDYIEVTLAEDLNTEAFKFRRLCGRLTSYDLHASGNIATVYYHTDDRSAASNLRGFKATFQAIDFNECDDPVYNPCDHHCHNTAGSFTCSCRDGWYLDADGRRCFDMNECALGNGGCERKCVNSAGSFRCECNPGFVLLSDGKRCGDEDGECRNSNAGCEQLCFEPSSPSGSPTCECREGYRLAADGVHCLDIDECTEGSHSCQHNCSNLHGSYSCSCRAGYQLNRNGHTCNNIDECMLGRDGCTHNCRDTDGSYECGCPNGLRLAANSHVCEDIDECEEGSARCSDGCRNTVGSYECFCPLGFRINSDSTTCVDIDECEEGSARCSHGCRNTIGSYQCFCPLGFYINSDGTTCVEHLNVSISVHYTYLDDFTSSPKEYKAASGPVTVTCTATGPERGTIHYQWSSTCRNCPFQSTTLRSIVRSAVHSGDNGTHTCAATRGRSTASASIDFYVVGAGVYIFRGSPRGNFPPNNGLVVSDNPARGDFRFRIFCRSDSVSENIGEFIGLDGAMVLTSNSFFAISRPQPGELKVENTVGSQSSLTASQQGVYTCRIPLYSGAMREFNIGVYPSGFNISPVIFALTLGSSSSTSLPILTCTSTGSPATTVTWKRDGKTLTINGSTYQMMQTVTNRPMATYENVLTINQSLADIVGSNFTCTVINVLGSDTSGSLHITGFGPVNECETDNGGCAHICTDSPTSYHCSCRSGYRMQTNGRRCDDIDECSTNNGGCAHICTNTPGSRECSCSPGFMLNNNSMDCTEHLDISISVDYTPPEDFIPGPNEYRAASGPVTVTCTATGVRTGPVSYQWSSTCRSCPYQSATSNSIKRAAVHSGDNGTHTCVATRGESTTSGRIDFHVVGAGVYIFRGSPRGNFPANSGLVVSDNDHFRFRIFCRSDSMSESVGEFIGLDGTTALRSNDIFAISQSQPGELIVENTVGFQNALTTRQQGVYTCRIPLQSGIVREVNVGVYPSGFNTPPKVVAMTLNSSNSSQTLICTTTGSPATTVTWTRDGRPVTVDGIIYQMMQTVTNRTISTYENVLSVSQPLAFILGSIFTCRVSNVLGSNISHNLEITAVGPVNECEANNGGCEHTCTDTATSYQCSCRPGYRLGTDGKACNDIDECNTNNGDCEQICINTQGSRQCGCRSGFLLASNGIDCTEHLIIKICADYTPPEDFILGPNEYRAASGPVTVTCTATGVRTGPVSYQWSSTCRSCPFQSATSNSIRRAAVHSGDNGTHTCVATRGDSTASASIDFLVVDAGVYIFRGSPRGNFPPNNGLVVSDNPAGGDFRFRIFCRSDSMSRNVGEFIGLDGTTALTSNDFFIISQPQAGELQIESRVGSQNALTGSQQGVYTCRIPLQSGKIREFNVGVYPSRFNTPPNILALTVQLLNSFPTLICTSTGSPATNVTWTRDGQPLTIDGSTYRMVQTVANRNNSTYENVLTINQTLASTVGSTFICGVSNVIGSDTSDSLQITGFDPVSECKTNNGGCEHICTDTATSFQCSCRSGYRLAADHRMCNDTNECSTSNGGCAQICTNTQGSRQCSCWPGFILANNNIDCLEHLNVSISVDYTPPADFIPGPNEYRAASGPVTVTCTAIGPGTGKISYQWSSTCVSCPFQSAESSSIKQIAVHSGDNGTHTCIATQGRNNASTSIHFYVVDAGIHIFRGIVHGSIPNNGLVVSEMPEIGFRLRIFCRSDSMLENIGQFIGPDGTNVNNNSFFATAHPQPGEMAIENIVGIHSVLTATQQGMYTCRIPTHNGEIREINIGIYPAGFSVPPTIKDLTIASSNSTSNFTCTSTGSPATNVTWTKNGQPLTIDGSTYRMTQTVINRSATTYENVLIINQTLASIADQTFTCTVRNEQGSDTSEMLVPTASSSCRRVLTTNSGNIQSPNWPTSYPVNTDCEWTISLSNPSQAIRFTFDDMYGIGGQPPCTTDYVAVLNGLEEDAPLLGRFCSANVPGPVTSSFGQAKIVFHAGPQHLESHRGFKINYQAVDRPPGHFSCGSLYLVAPGTPFGPPAFPYPITANSTGSSCKWRFIGSPGTTARLRIFYFDIPESDSCSESSLKIYHNSFNHPLTLSETLCGRLSKNEFMSIGNSMSVVMEIGTHAGYRGFHATFEQA